MDVGRGGVIRTRGIQLPKLALYQAELRPDARNLAEMLGVSNETALSEQGRIVPVRANVSRTTPERMAELTVVLDRRIAARIAPSSAR